MVPHFVEMAFIEFSALLFKTFTKTKLRTVTVNSNDFVTKKPLFSNWNFFQNLFFYIASWVFSKQNKSVTLNIVLQYILNFLYDKWSFEQIFVIKYLIFSLKSCLLKHLFSWKFFF